MRSNLLNLIVHMNDMKIFCIFQKELSVTYNITAKLKGKVTNSSVSALMVGWDFFTMIQPAYVTKMSIYITAQILRIFYFIFPLLRCSPSNSSKFAFILFYFFFLYTSYEGVLFSQSIFSNFNNRNINKSINQRTKFFFPTARVRS